LVLANLLAAMQEARGYIRELCVQIRENEDRIAFLEGEATADERPSDKTIWWAWRNGTHDGQERFVAYDQEFPVRPDGGDPLTSRSI
jgi:hypothetical protein